MWFEIKVELDEATETVKTVFCTQLGQAELSQIKVYGMEIYIIAKRIYFAVV